VLVRLAVALVALVLVASACGGKSSSSNKGGKSGFEGQKSGESGLADAGKPKRGGKIVYGLEAETGGGYCLAEGQLAISGIMVARALYDTLTVPNAAGVYTPYLAQSYSHSPDYKSWDIVLRPNIKFHDGSPLTAQVVKNNLDAYRGKYPGRSSLLFQFVLNNIDTTAATGPLTVRVTMKKPWVAFPAYMFSSGRLGIMAQAQLDDKEGCATKPIGTGPFKFVSWQPNVSLKANANPDYWQIAPDGKPYPYVNSVEFRPIPEGAQRVNSIQSGNINMMHTSSAEDISGTLTDLRNQDKINMYVTQDKTEVAYTMLNSARPPFNDENMRRAFAMGGNRQEINQITNNGLPTVADGPFAPGNVGYVKDPGFPKYNPTEAKRLVDAYRSGGGNPDFVLNSANDPQTVRLAELIQQDAKKIGINVKINSEEQAKLISDSIGGSFQAVTWRNHPGGDPDTQYVWWYGPSNPVNFGRFNDPVINQLLDQGRSEPDEAKRATIYEDLNREFAKKVWNVWGWFAPWAVAEGPNVHGIIGPKLPDGSLPSTQLAVGHTLIGVWIS